MEASDTLRQAQQPFEYFSAVAEVYTRYRPTYAPAAFDRLVAECGPTARIAAVGCGTGICCRQMAARGAHVIGIDPNEHMLGEARRLSTPPPGTIRYLTARAEATGMLDASVDLVLCAQSFHWFDEKTALREFHRILKPGGLVALVWNVRQEDGGLTTAYNQIARRAQDDAQEHGKIVCRTRRASPSASGLFDHEMLITYPNAQVLSEEQLLGRIRSTSYYPASDVLRDELDQAMHDAFAAYQQDGTVTLMQNTEMTLARRILT